MLNEKCLSYDEEFVLDSGDTVNQEECIMDDIITEESTRFSLHDSNTIRSRLRSATKPVSLTKNNRSRRNLKGTRQNQEPVHIRPLTNEVLPNNSRERALSNSISHANCKTKDKMETGNHNNWKKRCLRSTEKSQSTKCDCCIPGEDKVKIKLNEGESPLSKILNEDGCATIFSPDQSAKHSVSTNRKKGRASRSTVLFNGVVRIILI